MIARPFLIEEKSAKNYGNVDSADGPLTIGRRFYKVSSCSLLCAVFVFSGAFSKFYCLDTIIMVYLTPTMIFKI